MKYNRGSSYRKDNLVRDYTPSRKASTPHLVLPEKNEVTSKKELTK
jgi:hypothetical protein